MYVSLKYTYLMSKLDDMDGQHIRDNSSAMPVKHVVTTGRPLRTAMTICGAEEDCDQDGLSEQIANSRSRVSNFVHSN